MTATHWPILSFHPGRAQFFDRDCALEYSGSLAAPERGTLLEQCDAAFADAKTAADPDRREDIAGRLHWDPADRELREFLSLVRERARQAGGLRLVSREALQLPAEALRLGGEWSTSFPIVRMHARDAGLGFGDAYAHASSEEPGGRRPYRKLVWFNPAGEPELPAARSEAQAVFDQLEQAPGPTRFIARSLSDHEWYELYDSHDLVFYFGHGETVAGHPAILTKNGRAPFFAPPGFGASGANGAGRRCLVFAACLRGGEQLLFRNQAGAIVYPVCRLADRPAEFLLDFCRALAKGGASIPEAMLAACQADAASGDIRRFLFRLQGAGESLACDATPA
ncbi:MAG: hypothetical protein NXI24_18970 [bacterium]|nr:hypothetical protein [bacterium]